MTQAESSSPKAYLVRHGMMRFLGEFTPGPNVSAARGDDQDSANSPFFLMRAKFPQLERRYTAFGRVISGQNVVTSIKTGEPVAEPQDRMTTVRVLTPPGSPAAGAG